MENMSQGVLFGPDPAAAERSGLVKGVQATLDALEQSGVLRAEHQGIVELLRAEARDYVMARGIARTNYARLIGEHLTMLLEMEVPTEAGEEDDAGNRITKLSEFLQSRRLDSYVRHEEAT